MPDDSPTSSTALAVMDRGAPLPENDVPTASPYPRSGALLWLRILLLACWGIIVLYVGNAGWNLYQLAHDDLGALTNWDMVRPALTLPGFLDSASAPLWIDAVSAVIFVLLFIACLLATRDFERERHATLHTQVHAAISAAAPPLVATHVAQELNRRGYAPKSPDPATSPAAPQGPPYDLALLPDTTGFVGRSDDLTWLEGRLRQGGASAVTALRGMGGIGKSTLAAFAARRLHDQGVFPDGVAVVRCNDRSDPAEVLRLALARFASDPRVLDTADLAELATRARALLSGKRALIILDNIEPDLPVADVVRPLAESGVTLLLTARQQLPAAAVPLDAARRLGLLSDGEALSLFAESYGVAEPGALPANDLEAVRRIVKALARHTLAVKLAGVNAGEERAAALEQGHTPRPLTDLASELEADPRRALGLPEDDVDQAVELAFEQSVKKLPPDARRLFAALAAFPTEEFGERAAAALAESLHLERPDALLRLLVRRALADASTEEPLPEDADRDRLRLHPLLRAYATERFAEWPQADRDAASIALATYYAGYANATPNAYLSPDEANIIGMLDWAHDHATEADHTRDTLVARTCDGMRGYWRDRGKTLDALRFLPWGIEAAERIAEQTGERNDKLRAANTAVYYGDILKNVGRLADAENSYQRDLGIRRDIADKQGEGAALSRLGQIALSRGRLEEAEDYFTQSLAILREVKDRRSEGVDLSSLGQIAQRRGRLEEAEDYFTQSLAIRREVQDRRGEGTDLSSLGQIAQQRGRLEEAEDYFTQSLAIDREVQDRQGEGVDLASLGQIAVRRGRLEEAEDYFTQSLAINREVQSRQGEGVVLASLGQIAHVRGKANEAEEYYRQCLQVMVDVQDALNEGTIALILGRFLIEERANRDEGCSLISRAIRIRHDLGLPGEDEARETARALGCVV